jgi:hypothetical protein
VRFVPRSLSTGGRISAFGGSFDKVPLCFSFLIWKSMFGDFGENQELEVVVERKSRERKRARELRPVRRKRS